MICRCTYVGAPVSWVESDMNNWRKGQNGLKSLLSAGVPNSVFGNSRKPNYRPTTLRVRYTDSTVRCQYMWSGDLHTFPVPHQGATTHHTVPRLLHIFPAARGPYNVRRDEACATTCNVFEAFGMPLWNAKHQGGKGDVNSAFVLVCVSHSCPAGMYKYR